MTMTSILRNGATARTRPRLVLIATSLGVLFAQIDTSVVNLALKSIAGDLHAGVSAMQWVINSYSLVYASLLLTGGTLGDLFGRRRIFLLGIALFAFPDRKARAHAFGVWASCNGIAFIIGPTFGGWLVDSIGWRSIFYVILPVCTAAWVLTLYGVQESADPKGRRLDLPGQALAILGLSAFAFAAIEGSRWGRSSPVILALAGVAVVALALFVWVEARTPGPLLPLHFLRQTVFSAALACAGLMTFGMYALLFLMPLYFQTVRGGSPFIAGLELLPMSASFVAVSQYVGHLNNRFGPRIVMTAGMACMGAGALALAFIGEATPLAIVEFELFVVGIGLGLNTAPRTASPSRRCHPRDRAPRPAWSTPRAWSAPRSASPSSARCLPPMPANRPRPAQTSYPACKRP